MDPVSPTHAAITSLVDNYTHFESLHKQHPDLAKHVFSEVENLRQALDNFRITVALRTLKQQQYESITSVETDAPLYEPSAEQQQPPPPVDLEAQIETGIDRTES
jgi:hypothetical protein